MHNFGQVQVEDPELAAGEGENFNHRNILNISRINPPGGLKLESDPCTVFRSYGASVEIGQKGAFFKGLSS
jgi:hypothetical protein